MDADPSPSTTTRRTIAWSFWDRLNAGQLEEALDVLDDGDVLLEVESHATTPQGKPDNNVYCYIVTITGRRIRHVREYADTEHARETMPLAMVSRFREGVLNQPTKDRPQEAV